LLRAIAQRLASAIRDTDTVARLGGDEFAIVQTTVTRASDVTAYANRIVDLFDIPFEVAGRRVGLSTSIGVALAPQDGTDEDELLRCASLALHRAKTDGCGACRLFQADMDQEMRTRRQLELDLRQALSAGEFEVYFQPQVDMNLRRVTAVEALLRWRHPERGFVSPAQFIPIAEEIGLIVPIGEWVLRQACATVASWPGCLRLAVNLSAAQFKGHELVATVRNALKGAGLPADRLELEITESAMLRDTEATLATLHQLRELGVRTAMDDFGTGYSSLSYLLRFPFDRIKIDQSFVRELSASRDSNAIVRAVTGLGLELGMATTAEGVETQQQLETLLRAGCTEFQGYLFSPAVTGDRIAATVAAIAETLRQLEEQTPSQVAA
jgi:predicted signal transduction protein with EAL and GGDEF domain